jgi:phage tail tape-measure protein
MAKMKIKPLRTMFLDKRRVEQGKVEEVSEAEGKLAIRHGWAVAVADKKAATENLETEAKAKDEGNK